MYEKIKLYELAPILSPSIYETIFFSQYQSRLDKGALILDEKTFRDCYISDNTYRIFLESNCEKLNRCFFYIGVQQLYDSIISSIVLKDNDCKIRINYKAVKELANEVIKENNFALKSDDFFIDIKLKNIIHYSRNILDKKENLNPIEGNINNLIYLQDQITFIDNNAIEIVISVKNKESDNIEYLIFKAESIDIEEKARAKWIDIFPENFHTLYDFFINFRTKNSSCFDVSYKKIINEYQKFIELLDE